MGYEDVTVTQQSGNKGVDVVATVQFGITTVTEVVQVKRRGSEKSFGDSVVAIVDGTSDTDLTPKPSWRERKETYVAHVRNAPKSVRLDSAADKLHNARSILADLRTEGEVVWRRFTGGAEGTL